MAFSDDFNRADSVGLGANWTNPSSFTNGFDVASNQARTQVQNGTNIALTAADVATTDDNYAELSVNTTPTISTGIMCRASGVGTSTLTGYLFRSNGSNIILFRTVNNVFTNIASLTFAVAAGDVLKVEAIGTTIKGYVNGVEKLSVTDSGVTTGKKAGLRVDPGTGLDSFDNFSAGDAAAGGATATPSVIAATTALPSTGLSAGSAVSPNSIAVTTAVTSVEGIDAGVGADVVPIVAALPQATASVGSESSPNPGPIPIVVALPQAEALAVQDAQPNVIAAVVTFPDIEPLTETVITPEVIAVTTAVPQSALSTESSLTPESIAVVVGMPQTGTSFTLLRWTFVVGEIGNDWSFTKGTSGESRRLWEHFGEQPRGKTVIRTSGTWATHAYPSQRDFDAADLIAFPDGTVERAVLLGGHHTPVTGDTAAELIDQGFGAFVVGVEEAA